MKRPIKIALNPKSWKDTQGKTSTDYALVAGLVGVLAEA